MIGLRRDVYRSGRLLVIAVAGWGASLFLVAGSEATAMASLPNPCTLLAAARVQKALDPTTSVKVGSGHLTKYGSGEFADENCSETVGSITVSFSVFLQDFSSGGVIDPTELHPAGIGGGVIITGKSTTGTTVDIAHLHKGPVYANISTNGASPSGLTTLSQQIYNLMP
jgi:hypothetical protein